MKKSIITLMVILPFAGIAQTQSPESKSVLEHFASQSSSLIKKDFHTLAIIKGIEVQLFTMTEITNKTIVAGVCFKYEVHGEEAKTTNTNISITSTSIMDTYVPNHTFATSTSIASTPFAFTYFAFIDKDELRDLIKSLDYLLTTVFTNKVVEDFTEYEFETKGFMKAGAYNEEDKWHAFIQLDSRYPTSERFVSTDDLKDFLNALKEADYRLN